jgi:hypothetical protein
VTLDGPPQRQARLAGGIECVEECAKVTRLKGDRPLLLHDPLGCLHRPGQDELRQADSRIEAVWDEPFPAEDLMVPFPLEWAAQQRLFVERMPY